MRFQRLLFVFFFAAMLCTVVPASAGTEVTFLVDKDAFFLAGPDVDTVMNVSGRPLEDAALPVVFCYLYAPLSVIPAGSYPVHQVTMITHGLGSGSTKLHLVEVSGANAIGPGTKITKITSPSQAGVCSTIPNDDPDFVTYEFALVSGLIEKP